VVLRGLPPGAELPTGPVLAAKNHDDTTSISPETLAYYTSLYDAQINYVDDVLRAFFGSLESLDLLDDTVFIITSDHGEEFLEHGKLVHEQVYQECLRVPLIILSPEHQPGRRLTEIVRSIDLPATILELAQTPIARPISGISLVPLLAESSNWQAQESFARNHNNAARSLHIFDDRLIQAVSHRSIETEHGRWHSKQARFNTNRTEIAFEGLSYHRPRDIEILIDGERHSSITVDMTWRKFNLSVAGGSRTRTFTLRTPGCDVPALVEASADERCLSFRIVGFPEDRVELFNLSADPTGTNDIGATEPDLGSALEQRIETYEVASTVAGHTADLSQEEIERLKSLGYLQ
jgi:hypothetical protein